jgi:hypothetical protein
MGPWIISEKAIIAMRICGAFMIIVYNEVFLCDHPCKCGHFRRAVSMFCGISTACRPDTHHITPDDEVRDSPWDVGY